MILKSRTKTWRCINRRIPAKISVVCPDPLELSVTAAAAGLRRNTQGFLELLNGHSGVSPEMAIRLEKTGWSTADHWLRMQLSYDLWNARQRMSKIKVKRFKAPAAA